LAKFSKTLEKVVEFNLEEKEKFPIIVFVKKKRKETIQVSGGKNTDLKQYLKFKIENVP
jgi:hypothetical protein